MTKHGHVPAHRKTIAIIGGGPSGLAAAEILSEQGFQVTIYEAMPTLARKFLLAGKSGLNITHSEEYTLFRSRFGQAEAQLAPALDAFPPAALCQWAQGLDIALFTGSSGRVFPTRMKASPLLRNWLARLEARGVIIHKRHRWLGFSPQGFVFMTPQGEKTFSHDAALLALGGASWPRLGSDAAWLAPLRQQSIAIRDFVPANCGFNINWSELFASRYHGAPIKSVAASSAAGRVEGEFVISQQGIEGSLIYAHSAALRDQLHKTGAANLYLDLTPGRSAERLAKDLAKQSGKNSFSNRLRKATGLEGAKAALLRELLPESAHMPPLQLSQQIKQLALPLHSPRPIAEAISSAGGILWQEINSDYMLHKMPGIFVAGEMLDWEAPTGGYLLTACLASGRAAGQGIARWLRKPH